MEISGARGIRQIGSPEIPPDKKVIGLTGNPGAGKSTVAGLLAEYGAQVISADEIGYAMLKKDSPVYPNLIEAFGESILSRDGEIDRKVLGKLVFDSPEQLDRLNSLVHPAMTARIEHYIKSFRRSNEKGPLVIDAALIYEWGIADWFDGIITVTASQDVRKKRFIDGRGEAGNNFDDRESAQIPEERKKQLADTAIHNNSSLDQLRSTVKEWMEN